jgi:hypothetical protein
VLLISGDSDLVWDSSVMADAVVTRLKQTHFPFHYENLKYPHAGHAAGRPGIFPAWHGRFTHPVSGKPVDMGGSPKGDAESSLDATPKVLAFLRQSLQNQPTRVTEFPPILRIESSSVTSLRFCKKFRLQPSLPLWLRPKAAVVKTTRGFGAPTGWNASPAASDMAPCVNFRLSCRTQVRLEAIAMLQDSEF